MDIAGLPAGRPEPLSAHQGNHLDPEEGGTGERKWNGVGGFSDKFASANGVNPMTALPPSKMQR